MSNPVILFILDCGHVQPARVGVMQMECLNCNDGIHNVVDVHDFEWRVLCQSCNYKPWCGLSQMLANHNADGHGRKWSRHTVKIGYMRNPLAVKVKQRITEGIYVNPSSQ